jgi:hypothetical protein
MGMTQAPIPGAVASKAGTRHGCPTKLSAPSPYNASGRTSTQIHDFAFRRRSNRSTALAASGNREGRDGA